MTTSLQRALPLLSIVALFVQTFPVYAQELGLSSASRALTVTATKPIVMRLTGGYSYMPAGVREEGKFRVIFHIKPAGDQEMRIAARAPCCTTSGLVDGWQAVNLQRGVHCVVLHDNLKGVEIMSGDLSKIGSYHTIASPTRASFVSADFSCDGLVKEGDHVSVQMRLHVLGRGGWLLSDHALQNVIVGTP